MVNGVAICDDSYLDEKVYTVASQVRQLGYDGVHCGLLDSSQLFRKHLFEHLVRGSYTWPLESEADENVYTANLISESEFILLYSMGAQKVVL